MNETQDDLVFDQDETEIHSPEEQVVEIDNFAADVWAKLSRVDVGDNIETIESGSFKAQYLSWSWAWATLMRYYPMSEFTILDEERFEDGTVNTRIVVTIRDGIRTMDRFMWLPVMDRRNTAIQNPDARQISDSRMRCLVKALAMCGLGLDLWTGSDMPVGASEDPVSPEQLDQINKLIGVAEPDILRFLAWLKVDAVEDIPQSKFKQCINELERAIKRKSK
jgi:hypothetical protein